MHHQMREPGTQLVLLQHSQISDRLNSRVKRDHKKFFKAVMYKIQANQSGTRSIEVERPAFKAIEKYSVTPQPRRQQRHY